MKQPTLREALDKLAFDAGAWGANPDNEKPSVDQEVKKARISELKGLKMYDCFNEDYTNDPRPAKLVSIRLVELEKDNK